MMGWTTWGLVPPDGALEVTMILYKHHRGLIVGLPHTCPDPFIVLSCMNKWLEDA